MTPEGKLLWSAWLQLHGAGQDLLDEIDRLEAENADLKNQIKIFEYNETNFVKLLQENDPELEALRLRAVPDLGQPGQRPTKDGHYWFKRRQGFSRLIILELAGGGWFDGVNMKQLTGEEMIEKCLWKEDEDGIWQTTCSEAYEIMAGTPKENGFIYCPYCGEKIEQKLYKEKK